jgi:exodeoxyribonuclease-3
MNSKLRGVFTVSTVNINGLRAAAKKGYVDWLASTKADVVCLQEVRADMAQLPTEVRVPAGWHAFYAPADIKGRSGVALLSRTEPQGVRVGFGEPEFDRSGRYLEIVLPKIVIGSLYLPSGDVGTSRQDEKERFMAAFLPYLVELREKAAVDRREVLVCGDWNIAHREADLKAWRANQESSGFLPSERAWLDRVFGEARYVDVVRHLHPDRPGPYTWWSYRGRAFDSDTGWRIDYQVATQALASRAVTAVVERASSYDKRWSDHAPVTVSYDWPVITSNTEK